MTTQVRIEEKRREERLAGAVWEVEQIVRRQ
jgi:hypothetical protein